jgi:hypothetical protein
MRLAWLAPDEKNVLQVWVKPIAEKSGKQVTEDRRRGIRTYLWAENDHTLLYLQDSDGDEPSGRGLKINLPAAEQMRPQQPGVEYHEHGQRKPDKHPHGQASQVFGPGLHQSRGGSPHA